MDSPGRRSPIKRTTTALGAIAIALALNVRIARALEVSLEENKAQRGNIGYVDMQKLFRLYPETEKAKANFEDVLRQAEEQVNLRKAELIGLRAEVIKIRMERDAAAKLAGGMPAAPTTAAAPAPSLPGAASATPAVSTQAAQAHSLATASTETASGSAAVERSTVAAAALASSTSASAEAPIDPAKGEPLVINLPGLSSDPIVVQPPSGTQNAAALNDLEARLAEKSRILQEKEAEFKTYQAQVEKNLLDLESRKTEIILGKIYHAVQDVAREEGVSVVVDKSQILFGHNAMDLTEKVLKRLGS